MNDLGVKRGIKLSIYICTASHYFDSKIVLGEDTGKGDM